MSLLLASGCNGILGIDPDGFAATDASVTVDGGADIADGAVVPVPSMLPSSCREVLSTGTKSNGTYTIDPDGSGALPPVEVYCEMEIERGGWTLVARSIENGAGPFGWRVGTGGVANDEATYSLGSSAFALGFTEVLVAERVGAGKEIGTIAYELGLTSAELQGRDATTTTGYVVTKVRGACAPSPAPYMLQNAGLTASGASYHFANLEPSKASYGLGPNGFDLSFPDCPWSGALHRKQGMLFVR